MLHRDGVFRDLLLRSLMLEEANLVALHITDLGDHNVGLEVEVDAPGREHLFDLRGHRGMGRP
ncbi:MAG TPA: hypothetical protein VNC40_01840 [Gaiellaceae bacterium]|nr:hypothetical protein [Gaiellaceae bacterium]